MYRKCCGDSQMTEQKLRILEDRWDINCNEDLILMNYTMRHLITLILVIFGLMLPTILKTMKTTQHIWINYVQNLEAINSVKMLFIPEIIKIRVVHAQLKNGPKYPAMDWTMPDRRIGQQYVGCILVRNPNLGYLALTTLIIVKQWN